jgi:hypothetical protein
VAFPHVRCAVLRSPSRPRPAEFVSDAHPPFCSSPPRPHTFPLHPLPPLTTSLINGRNYLPSQNCMIYRF